MKQFERSNGKLKVEFLFESENAKEVRLLGDFNQWNTQIKPMKKNKKGVWKKTMDLEPGTYEYKFKVDGEWQTDEKNALVCDNCFGTKNNFVLVN